MRLNTSRVTLVNKIRRRRLIDYDDIAGIGFDYVVMNVRDLPEGATEGATALLSAPDPDQELHVVVDGKWQRVHCSWYPPKADDKLERIRAILDEPTT